MAKKKYKMNEAEITTVEKMKRLINEVESGDQPSFVLADFEDAGNDQCKLEIQSIWTSTEMIAQMVKGIIDNNPNIMPQLIISKLEELTSKEAA